MARISVFKGREARLNKAIFWILALQAPLTIYDIWRKLRDQRDFTYIRYHIVNRRVRALEERGYIEKSGERRAKTGFMARLYQMSVRAYLAMLLDKTDLDRFIEEAFEDNILTTLAGLFSNALR
jgi:DNA-binding PadR family transcriptional regulator